ncbi:putative membrane protein [Sulfurospirillum halorespirans DSM 13726]|uniref:Putative membrane protein n=2 Tax=Sulfurospirillum halorespirans TaxID=194424 RepID=A0A1D7TMC5_9BACT|nr:putative membrane protein [Sulfurospirillum halorespirans DSM 13726]
MGSINSKPFVYRLMKTFLHVKAKKLWLLCFIAFFPVLIFAKDFVVYDDILEERTAQKIEEMGSELFAKSGVKVILIAKKSGEGENILTYEQNFVKNLTTPYVLLTLFQAEKKVDIYASAGLEKEFDREALLSPFPWSGTIIPLLTSKKNDVSVGPALLNGYAELVEEIAQYRKIELESAIGSANKTTINLVRLLIYGFMAIVVVLIIYKRIKNRGQS